MPSRPAIRLLATSALAALAAGPASAEAAEAELPFAADVLVSDFEAYQKEIRQKADDLVAERRRTTIAKLEAEAAKQSKAGNTDAARAILAVVEGWRADAGAAEKAAELAARRWTPLFETDNLPAGWNMPEEPDGGWEYKSGTLEMQSLKKYAVALHEAPPGDLVVRAKMKLDPNGDDEKEQQAGIGFIASEDSVLAAIAQAPGLMIAYGNVGGGEKLLGMERSAACQRKFSEVEVAWVGSRFMVFARGKLLINTDVKARRGKAGIALSAHNAAASFREVEFRVPNRDDLARLKAGKSIE